MDNPSTSAPDALKDRESQGEYHAPRVNLSLKDFNIRGRIGEGSFSMVVLAEHKATGKQYALKIMNKHQIMRNKAVDYIRNERNILDKLDDAGVAKLYFTFQDSDSLYMGLEHCPGGELYDQIQRRGRFDLATTQFYSAEIVLILEYLRSKDIVHRDLKPENLLLSAGGHLKLIDFGSARAGFLPAQERPTKARATSFVGTAEYVSPEVLMNQPLSYPADLWAFGCIIFQMLTGTPPFKAASEYLTFQKVSERDFALPADFPEDARDLVDKLLQPEPDKRIGAKSLDELKGHRFFLGINWQNLRSQPAPEILPPPTISADEEALDWELTSLMQHAQEFEVRPEAQE